MPNTNIWILPPPQLSIFWRPWAQRHCSVFLTTSKNVDSATYCLTYPSLNKILRFATCVYRQNVGLLKMFLKVPSAQVAFWTNQRRWLTHSSPKNTMSLSISKLTIGRKQCFINIHATCSPVCLLIFCFGHRPIFRRLTISSAGYRRHRIFRKLTWLQELMLVYQKQMRPLQKYARIPFHIEYHFFPRLLPRKKEL